MAMPKKDGTGPKVQGPGSGKVGKQTKSYNRGV